jgi:hypothetical protein
VLPDCPAQHSDDFSIPLASRRERVQQAPSFVGAECVLQFVAGCLKDRRLAQHCFAPQRIGRSAKQGCQAAIFFDGKWRRNLPKWMGFG